jgi:hypothetical protein
MDNVQKHNNCDIIPSTQTFRSYLHLLHLLDVLCLFKLQLLLKVSWLTVIKIRTAIQELSFLEQFTMYTMELCNVITSKT